METLCANLRTIVDKDDFKSFLDANVSADDVAAVLPHIYEQQKLTILLSHVDKNGNRVSLDDLKRLLLTVHHTTAKVILQHSMVEHDVQSAIKRYITQNSIAGVAMYLNQNLAPLAPLSEDLVDLAAYAMEKRNIDAFKLLVEFVDRHGKKVDMYSVLKCHEVSLEFASYILENHSIKKM
jgi:hypothetical protein